MNATLRRFAWRWLGIGMLIAALFLFIMSGQVVNIPGPVETAKSNYIVTHSLLSIIRSGALALAGGALVMWNFKSK